MSVFSPFTWLPGGALCTQPAPQHFLYFFPLPHGQGSLRPTFGSGRTTAPES